MVQLKELQKNLRKIIKNSIKGALNLPGQPEKGQPEIFLKSQS
jgi:hypothetical protein